jgi:hypothetical protein
MKTQSPILRIDDRTLSLEQILQYLEANGRLKTFLWKIILTVFVGLVPSA